MADILYKGANPPNSLSGLSVVESGVSAATLLQYFTDGRQQNNNYNIILRDGISGAVYYTPPPPPVTPAPRILSKTDFNKLGWATLGMAAFQTILDGVRANTGTTDAEKEARAVVQQYDSALTLSKAEVAALGTKLVPGFMTAEQKDTILAAWPVG